jgi:hypothetical protein
MVHLEVLVQIKLEDLAEEAAEAIPEPARVVEGGIQVAVAPTPKARVAVARILLMVPLHSLHLATYLQGMLQLQRCDENLKNKYNRL